MFRLKCAVALSSILSLTLLVMSVQGMQQAERDHETQSELNPEVIAQLRDRQYGDLNKFGVADCLSLTPYIRNNELEDLVRLSAISCLDRWLTRDKPDFAPILEAVHFDEWTSKAVKDRFVHVVIRYMNRDEIAQWAIPRIENLHPRGLAALLHWSVAQDHRWLDDEDAQRLTEVLVARFPSAMIESANDPCHFPFSFAWAERRYPFSDDKHSGSIVEAAFVVVNAPADYGIGNLDTMFGTIAARYHTAPDDISVKITSLLESANEDYSRVLLWLIYKHTLSDNKDRQAWADLVTARFPDLKTFAERMRDTNVALQPGVKAIDAEVLDAFRREAHRVRRQKAGNAGPVA